MFAVKQLTSFLELAFNLQYFGRNYCFIWINKFNYT